MKKVLNRLDQASRHLKAIDAFFCAHVPEYNRNEQKLSELGRYYEEFSRTLYAGGRIDGNAKDGNRYHRGIMLSDILTYAVLGRGFYMATVSGEHRKAFVNIVMRIVNKLLIQENVSTDSNLRGRMLDTVAALGLENFYENKEQRRRFDLLRGYEGMIIWKQEGKEYYTIMDGHLPKSRGLAIEFLIYLYLISKKFGFIVPLLIHQRLMSQGHNIAPPDFLILKTDGRIIGIEVGSFKEGQNTEFVSRTSIPIITAELDHDQPFRCPECRQWITYCDRVIESYSEGTLTSESIQCKECQNFNGGSCPEIIYFGKVPGKKKELRYHFRCIAGKDWIQKVANRDESLFPHLKVWYPSASTLDSLLD